MQQSTDKIILLLGRKSRFQIFFYCLGALCSYWPFLLHSISWGYIGGTPPHSCVPSILTTGNATLNITWTKTPHNERWAEFEGQQEAVGMLENNKDIDDVCEIINDKSQCADIVFDKSWGTTAITEWSLICEKAFLGTLVQLIATVGCIPAALLSSGLSDKYGRRTVMIGCQLVMLVFGGLSAIVKNYWFHLVLRAVCISVGIGTLPSAYTYCAEILSSEYRSWVGVGVGASAVTAELALVCIAYVVRNWRIMQLVASSISIPIIVYLWFCPESLVWLHSKGRYTDVKSVLKRAAKMNKKNEAKVLEQYEIMLREQTTNHDQGTSETKIKPKATLRDITKSRVMTLITLIMSAQRLSVNTFYWGLALATAAISGDRYWNLTISALVEVPGLLFCLFILKIVGRRTSLITHNVIALALLIGATVANTIAPGIYVTLLAIVARGVLMGVFGILLVYVPELFPTQIRSLGVGLGILASFIGVSLASFYSTLASQKPWIPTAVCLFLQTIATAGSFYLPETRGFPLPETIADVEEVKKNKRKASSETTTDENSEKQQMINEEQNDPPKNV